MIALLKISPVLVLGTLMVLEFDPLIAAPIATIYACLIAMLTKKDKFSTIVDSAMENVKNILVALFILMLAYAMASAFMSTGVGASVITLALRLGVTGRNVAVVGVAITSLLSIATGTSWGTFAACAPIFLWLNHILGGNIALTTAAIAGGSCFGDNIGLISDTTIVSSSIQGVEITKRIRHQGFWSLFVLVSGLITFYLAGIFMKLPTISGDPVEAIMKITPDIWVKLSEENAESVMLLEQVRDGIPLYMVLPLIFVLVLAFLGYQTFICLFTGIVFAFLLGYFAGTVSDIMSYLDMVKKGFSEAGSWVVVMMMWVAAFGGIMKFMDAFKPISTILSRISKNVRQLMFFNALLTLFGNAALADEMAQIVTVGPIIKEIVEENVEGSEEDLYTLKLRNATYSDAMGVFGSQLIPWHVYLIYYLGILKLVYPIYEFKVMDIIKYNFMAFIAVGSILILTITGLDRFIPMFKIPSEPDVKLKNK